MTRHSPWLWIAVAIACGLLALALFLVECCTAPESVQYEPSLRIMAGVSPTNTPIGTLLVTDKKVTKMGLEGSFFGIRGNTITLQTAGVITLRVWREACTSYSGSGREARHLTSSRVFH
jgi:hypothetical protein